MQRKIPLLLIVLIALTTRIFLINWDSGYHLHPDERMIVMVADRIHFFDNLNPDFFNYGSLPIYLLKAAADFHDIVWGTLSGLIHVQFHPLSNYDGLLGVGRILASVFDTVTCLIIYRLAYLLSRSKKTALFSALTYTVAFFPIQNSHFYVVDGLLTMLATFLVYRMTLYQKKQTVQSALILGILAGASVATKFTAVVFLPIVTFSLILPLISFLKKPSREKNQTRHAVQKTVFHLFLFGLAGLVVSFISMPYGYLLPIRSSVTCLTSPSCDTVVSELPVVRDILFQTRMNSNAFVFPYTLQYVGTIPYWYHVKNIFWWGWGPPLSILSLIGLVGLIGRMGFIRPIGRIRHLGHIVLICIFYSLYFVVLGKSAVKFMRYMLPLYPLFALLAGYGLTNLFSSHFPNRWLPKSLGIGLLVSTFIWTSMFLSIYTTPNTRVQASEWIYRNIPVSATIATEHWDDRLPLRLSFKNDERLYYAEMYPHEELALYEPDTEQKWNHINEQLKRIDYIVIASNRLYTPLMKLTNCRQLPEGKCFRQTAQYYNDLFEGKRGFTKVAEFTSFPRLGIGTWNIEIDDLASDESFTVYDHPKIMIFKRNQ